jgi:hypothetical protein
VTRQAKTGVAAALLLVGTILFWQLCGFYTVQPIGAIPEGRTLLVWRTDDEPFFNSPDATCLRRTGSVTLLCRGMAMGQGPIHRIILRLPYMEFMYKASTGGVTFDR